MKLSTRRATEQPVVNDKRKFLFGEKPLTEAKSHRFSTHRNTTAPTSQETLKCEHQFQSKLCSCGKEKFDDFTDSSDFRQKRGLGFTFRRQTY